MYGWINDCIEKFIVSRFGIDTWNQIKNNAHVRQPYGQWLVKRYYSDESTYALVAAASEVMGIESSQFYEQYGEFFISFMCSRGYENLMKSLGTNLKEWFTRVNLMHSHLEYSLPNIIAPDIWCSDEETSTDKSFILCHRTHRGNFLAPMLVGMAREAALRFFKQRIHTELLTAQGTGSAEFTSWRVTILEVNGTSISSSTPDSVQLLSSEISPAALSDLCPYAKGAQPVSNLSRRDLNTTATLTNEVQLPGLKSSNVKIEPLQTETSIPDASGFGLNSAQLKRLFPYHLVISKDLKIVQMGNAVKQNVSEVKIGDSISLYFSIMRSHFSWDWSLLRTLGASENIEIAVQAPYSKTKTHFFLAGELSFSDDKEFAYLLVSPSTSQYSRDVEQDTNIIAPRGKTVLNRPSTFTDQIEDSTVNLQIRSLSRLLDEERGSSFRSVVEMYNISQQALAIKKTFLRFISHEIRTPLTVVQLGLSVFERQMLQCPTPECQTNVENVHVCLESLDAAVSVLDDLLTYEKLDSGIVETKKRPLKLINFVNAAVDICRSQGLRRGVSFKVEFVDDALLEKYLYIDPKQISHLIEKFLLNAVKLTSENSVIVIQVSRLDRQDDEDVVTKTSVTLDPVPSNKSAADDLCSQLSGISDISLYQSKTFLDPIHTLPKSKKRCGALGEEVNDLFDFDMPVKIEVINKIHGITEESQKKLLHDLQFNPEELTAVGGSGLGMFVSKGIANLHDGEVTLESMGSGSGLIFTLTLPCYNLKSSAQLSLEILKSFEDTSQYLFSKNGTLLKKAATAPSTPMNTPNSICSKDIVLPPVDIAASEIDCNVDTIEPREACDMTNKTASCFRNKRCLIVDDVKMVRKMVEQALAKRGGICVQVEDGFGALECVKETIGTPQEFDIILMDFVMPNMDGPTATQKLREIGCKNLILGITGNVLPEDVELFLHKGANAVFGKPVSFDDVEEYLLEYYSEKI